MQTKSNKQRKIKNGIRYDINGFIYISIKGTPKERGYAYGKLVAQDMKQVFKIINFIVYNDTGMKWDYFIYLSNKYFKDKIKNTFPEFYQEMQGFAEGSNHTIDEIIAWNNYYTLTENFWGNLPEEEKKLLNLTTLNKPSSLEGGTKDRCSAFIAVGDWTEDTKIVCAHNNFSNFIDGQFAKYVIDIQPTNGNRILMLSSPGWIWSGTDFFVCSSGILGTETTIGGFISYENNIPISCRIRNAMQYGNTLDDYETMLLD
jgi:hypothetical protein